MTPSKVKKLRALTGKTQVDSAKDVHVSTRTWQSWETTAKSDSNRTMPEGLVELYCIKNKIKYPPKLS